MQNMHNIHAKVAVQERIHFSVSLGNQFGKYLLKMDANCKMNHEIVPKSIDRLRRAQNVSAQHKQITNMQNIQNTQNTQNTQYAKYA